MWFQSKFHCSLEMWYLSGVCAVINAERHDGIDGPENIFLSKNVLFKSKK